MEEEDKHSVQITEDNNALSDLKLSWKIPEFSPEDGIGPLDSLHQAGDGMVAVTRIDDDGATVLGSGVMVGPGLILTATHVLDEFPRESGGPVFMTFLPKAARAWLPKDVSALSREHKYDASRTVVSDITLVSCTLNSEAHADSPLMLTPMQVALPLVGERLWAIGFRHQGLNGASASVTPLISSGLVTQAFPFGRGERMPAACFEVAMETVGGMSGGAVVNAAGRLIGIVSSSIEGGPSYVTLLWDAIRLKVDYAVPKLSESKTISLLRAKELGLAKLEGDVDRDPWGEVTFRLSDEESKFFEESVPPNERKSARIPAMSTARLEEFVDTWGFEMETAASEAAIETLKVMSLPRIRDFLAASDIPADYLDCITGFAVEDFGGVEDLTVTFTTKITDEVLGLEFYFQLHQLIWTVEVSDKIFRADKDQWLTYFGYVQTDGDMTKLLTRQRCFFKANMVFDANSEDFADVSIMSAAIKRKRVPRKGSGLG